MIKKIGIVLFLVLAAQYAGRPQGAAPTILPGLAFADTRTQDGQPCPPECVSDSMEIVTWYPSPYNEYEELRLYPTQRDANYCDNDKIGLMYYDHGGTPSFPDNDKMMICKGTLLGWQEVGGGGDGVSTTQIDSTAIYPNSIKGYAKITVDGVDYALPYYTYYPSLIGNIHTGAQCLSAGGSIVADNIGNSFCKFSGSSCSSGWSQHSNWSTTTGGGTFCDGNGIYTNGSVQCASWSNCCSIDNHSWSNVVQERCSHVDSPYCNKGLNLGSLPIVYNVATITEIGCY